jgi:hypothetical protein
MKKWTRGSKTTQKSDCQCMTAYQAGLSVPDSFNFPDDGFYQIGSVCEDCPPNANCSSRDDALGLSVGQIFAKTGAWRAFWNDTIFLNCKSGYSGVSAEKIAENRCCPNATKCSQINTELNQTARAVFMDDQEEREWQTQWRNKQCLCTTDECYSGPMCMVCGGLRGDAYVLDPLSKKCKACNHGKPNMFYALAGLALVSSVIFLVVTVIIFHTHIGANEAAGKGMDDYEEEKARERAEIADQLAIMISWAQILSSVTLTYDGVLWPAAFETFSLGASFVDIDLPVILPLVHCQLAISFLDKFMLHLATPFAVVLTVKLALFAAKARGAKTPLINRQLEAQRAISDKCIFFMLLLLYPGLSRRIFQVFRCSEFDIASSVEHQDLKWRQDFKYSLLESDYAVPCYEDKWNSYAAYAGVGVVLFSIGMPLALFYELWRKRKSLHNKAHPQHRDTLRRLGFLYESYGAYVFPGSHIFPFFSFISYCCSLTQRALTRHILKHLSPWKRSRTRILVVGERSFDKKVLAHWRSRRYRTGHASSAYCRIFMLHLLHDARAEDQPVHWRPRGYPVIPLFSLAFHDNAGRPREDH